MARIAGILIALALGTATWWQVPPAAAAPKLQSAPCAVAAAAALAQRGKSYVWGAKGPNSFDCSGLTSWAWGQAGYNIGPSTYDQASKGVPIPCRLADIAGPSTTCWEPGDLIFLRYSGGQHVAMYVGNGLFADAYNQASGVIIHNPAADPFYQANFWQARRIVDCDGASVPVNGPDPLPSLPPALEELPDILAPVSFSVPQCNQCTADGSIILPYQPWSGRWPSGFESLNLPLVLQTVISWLAWQVSEIIRQLLCWLLNMLQILAGILMSATNALIYGANSLFKLGVLIWLTLKDWFFAFWGLFESLRQLQLVVAAGLAGLGELGRLIAEVALLIALLLGRLVVMAGSLALSAIGMLGWLGGVVLGFVLQLQQALSGTTAPDQLVNTHIIYRATRGVLEGVRDSQIGWTFPLLWGMAYVAFVLWLSRFLSSSNEA